MNLHANLTANSIVKTLATAAEPDVAQSETELWPLSLWLSRAMFVVAFVMQIFVAWRFRSLTWDDSAITLGFARTLAQTGRIEPTPGSGIVEGYSTTLWMLLMALAAKFAAHPSMLLAVAKLSTLLLNLANLLLIRCWLRSWTAETVANLVAGTIGCGLMFYETINGMETPLIMALVLAMLLLYPRRSARAYAIYLLLGSALLLCRWEAAWLLAPFVLTGMASTTRRQWTAALVWAGVFCASNLIRWRYFGSLLPNTIIAKQGIPYSEATPHLRLLSHEMEFVGLFAYSKVLVGIALGCLLYQHFESRRTHPLADRLRSAWRTSWQFRFTLLFTLFGIVLTTAIGQNLGPVFRSFYPAWPFFFCLLLLPLTWPRIARSRILPWVTASIVLTGFFRMATQLRDMRSVNAPIYMPRVTVGTVARVADAVAAVQAASHRRNVVFAGPDMGGMMLYSNGVQVVDTGLLCNAVLARRRFAAMRDYVFGQRHPDIMDTHDRWTELENLDGYPPFFLDYRPVYVDGVRLFVTRPVLGGIDPARLSEHEFSAQGQADPNTGARPVSAVDSELNRRFGRYLVLR